MDTGGGSENGKVHVGNNGLSWDIWSVGNWETSSPSPLSSTPSTFHNNHHQTVPISTIHQHHYTHRDFGGGGRDGHGAEAHHHLTCLKLGKRQYYEGEHEGTKKERIVLLGSSSSSASASVPRCQVEGCNVALADAKDYHRRHKVCALHSKAPKVVVHGLEQRFCQQCSRFHVTSEFDDTKRSCRRRLAGHNERRRKSSSDSITRNPSHGRALSLLSAEASRWVSSDISYRSSAALRELIAENRAALLGRQLLFDRSYHTTTIEDHVSVSPFLHPQHLPLGAPMNLPEGWHHFHEANPHVTLDLLQVPGSSLEFLPGRSKSKEEEECCEIWKSLEETHVA